VIAVLLALAWLFATLSLLAVGSANAVLPDMQRAVVVTHRWMSEREFLELFALSRIAPGPGSLIVALVGQKVAGLPGAAVSVLAMFTPSCLLVYGVSRLWHRMRDAPWRGRLERGVAPLAIGLTYASGLALMRSTLHGWEAVALTAAATGALALTEAHPLWVLGAGAAAGYALGL